MTPDATQKTPSWLREHALDIALIALALSFGLVSLSYPFGRDQGLYGYVAREWVLRGQIPYRDVYDHKTPGIYFLHALTILVFGPTLWGIRVADLLGVGAMGVLCARLATPRDSRIPRGLSGLAVFAGSVVYYGFFDFWNTAQSELWYSTLGLASICAIARMKRETRAQIVSGVFGGMAMVMKPPAIWFVLIAVVLLLARAKETAARAGVTQLPVGSFVQALVRFGVGFFAVVALTLGYFGLHHALAAMADIVIGANGYYVAHERGVSSPLDALGRIGEFTLILLAVLVVPLVATLALAVKAKRAGDVERTRRLGLALAALVAALLAVAMQQKFYLLHWGVIVGPLTLLIACMAYEAMQTARLRRFPTAAAPMLAVAMLVMYASTWPGGGPPTWLHSNWRAIARWQGKITHQEYADDWFVNIPGYSYRDVDDVSRWLNDHLSADEQTIAVRGFNPEVYIATGRHYVGRFFWTNFLTDPHRAYRRPTYLAEDAAAFASAPPRFVVTLDYAHGNEDSTEFFEARGYHVVQRFRTLTILERNSPTPS